MELVYQNYEEFDRIFSGKIQETKEHMKTVAGDFVEIGYLLKRARDTDILKASGYRNIYEYAEDKYKVDKSGVSRYIRINDRFSEGGYSPQLKNQYQEFGVAKLAIMLQLPDAVNEELTPEFSKAEIQMIKEEIDAERQITDIEVMLEEPPAWQQDEESLEYKALKQLFHDEPELYLNLCITKAAEKELFSLLAPMGEKIYTVRIADTGGFNISIKENAETIALINIRSEEKLNYPKQQIAEILRVMLAVPEGEEKEHWSQIYGEKWPVQEEETEQKKSKPSRVTKAKVKKKPIRKEEPEKEKVAPVQQNPEEEAEIPVRQQDSQEEAPEEPEENGEEVLSGEVENPSDGVNTEHETDSPPMTEEEFQKRMEEYREEFRKELEGAGHSIGDYNFTLTRRFLRDATDILNKMEQLDDKYEEYQL